MAAELVTAGGMGEPVALVPEEGLLPYLRTLYRVARAPEASHWCTLGHNRWHALTKPSPIVPLTLVAVSQQEAR